MKLRNKKTGEIGYPYFQNWKEITCVIVDENGIQISVYTSLAKLNEEWEDYEEPKEYWYICSTRNYEITRVVIDEGTDFDRVKKDKEISNYFNTREQAEKAVEKLKAWKRLKDKGFKFIGLGIDSWDKDDIKFEINLPENFDERAECQEIKDLNLLFGGEE